MKSRSRGHFGGLNLNDMKIRSHCECLETLRERTWKKCLEYKGGACDFSCRAHTAHTVCSFWAQTESNSDLPAFIWLHRVTRIWADSDTGPGGTIMWKKASHLLWAQSYPGCFSSIFETRHLLKSNKVWCLSFHPAFPHFLARSSDSPEPSPGSRRLRWNRRC